MNQSEDEYGFVGKNFRNKKLVVVLVFAVVVTSKAHYYQISVCISTICDVYYSSKKFHTTRSKITFHMWLRMKFM